MKIAGFPDITYRQYVKLIYDYILTGTVQDLIEYSEDAMKDIYNLLISPNMATAPRAISNLMNATQNFEDKRKAICNYVAALFNNTLTSLSKDQVKRHIMVIDHLKTELSYSCQKADFLQRITSIVITPGA
jgi:hypothetical protein